MPYVYITCYKTNICSPIKILDCDIVSFASCILYTMKSL